MTVTETEMERATEIASAHTYLATAKYGVEHAITRLNYTDVEIEEELWEVHEILQKLLIKLREEMYKGVKE